MFRQIVNDNALYSRNLFVDNEQWHDFEKKVAEGSASEEEKSELGRIVRISSPNSQAYSTAEERSTQALKAFDSNKYLIEEAAARRGVSPALLSSIYFKKVADDGTVQGAVEPRYAKLAYNKVFGQPLSWDDETLNAYLNTPEGMLDFMAIGILSAADFYGYDLATLSKQQIVDVLEQYGEWFNTGSDFQSIALQYNDIFEDIYKKMPSKDYDIKIV